MNKNQKPKYILKVTIIIIASLLFIGLGIFGNIKVKDNLKDKLVQDYGQQEKLVSEQVSSSLENKIINIKNSLYAIAEDPDIKGSDPQKCLATVQKYNNKLDLGVDNLGRVDIDKNFTCSINQALVGTSAEKLGNYLDPLFDEPTHPYVVSRQLKIPAVESLVIAVHVPVFDDSGKFSGSIGGAIYLDELAKNNLSDIKFASTGFVGLHDDNGDILYTKLSDYIGKNIFSTEIKQQLVRSDEYYEAVQAAYDGNGSIFNFTFDGIPRLSAVTPVKISPNHNWAVIVHVPKEEIAAVYVSGGLNNAFNAILFLYLVIIGSVCSLLMYVIFRGHELNKAKDDFMSLASHQLRTPLTAINWNSEILLSGQTGKVALNQEKYLRAINSSGKRMSELVTALLDASRLDIGKFEFHYVLKDITKLVNTVLSDLSGEIDRKKINFKLKTNLKTDEAMIDPKWLSAILQNLLSNAIKYTPEGGDVTLNLTQIDAGSSLNNKRIKKSSLYIYVSDNGYGIPKKQQQKIFSKMFRADNVLEKESGTGLGLYIIKKIVEELDGKIWFESMQDYGTVFSVIIPTEFKQTKEKASLK